MAKTKKYAGGGTPTKSPDDVTLSNPGNAPAITAGGAGPISNTLAGMASGQGTYGTVPDPTVLAANAAAGYTPGANYPASGTTPSGLKYVEIGTPAQSASDPNTYTPGVYGTFDPTSDPATRDNSTLGYTGAPMYEVFQPNGSGGWGPGYNVPMNTNLNSIGTLPGQTPPNMIPGTTANNYSTLAGGYGNVSGQSSNPPIGNYNPSASINPPKPEVQRSTGANAPDPRATPAYAQQVNAQMQAANNASTSAYYAYNPDAYPGPSGDPNTPDTMAQAQAWAAQSPANTAQAAQWQTQNTQDAAARAAFPSLGITPSATGGGTPSAAPAPTARSKGGRIGYAKGGIVGDTKPRYVGVIHKHGG